MARTKQLAKKARANKKPMTGGVRKPHKFKPGTVAFREIKRFQTGTKAKPKDATKLILPKSTMKRVIREVLSQVAPTQDWRISADAVAMLHEESEEMLRSVFVDAQCQAIHRGKQTCTVADMKRAMFVRGNKSNYSTHVPVDDPEGIIVGAGPPAPAAPAEGKSGE